VAFDVIEQFPESGDLTVKWVTVASTLGGLFPTPTTPTPTASP